MTVARAVLQARTVEKIVTSSIIDQRNDEESRSHTEVPSIDNDAEKRDQRKDVHHPDDMQERWKKFDVIPRVLRQPLPTLYLAEIHVSLETHSRMNTHADFQFSARL